MPTSPASEDPDPLEAVLWLELLHFLQILVDETSNESFKESLQ